MKRRGVRRRLFNLAAVGSAVLCVAIGVSWVRCHWVADFLSWTTHAGDGGFTCYELDSINGSFHLGRMHSRATPPEFGMQWTHSPAGRVRVSNDRWGFGLVRQDASGTSVAIWEIWFPHWLAMLFPGTIAACWVWDRIGKARTAGRLARNCCPACGYDLRATPARGGALLARCPECGHASGDAGGEKGGAGKQGTTNEHE